MGKEKRKVRIGFAGVGGMGQCAHLRNYATLADCEVVALAEIQKDMVAKVAARYGIGKVYSDCSEMISKEKLDGIVASQPFTRHGQLVPDLLKAGIPVFTEKPIAGSLEVGRRIVDAVRKSGTWMMIGYHKRSDPATMYAKAEIDRLKNTGELGKLKYVRITLAGNDWMNNGFFDLIPTNEPRPNLKHDDPAKDMNEEQYRHYISFVNYYIHHVNLMRHLLGESYEVKFVSGSEMMLAVRSRSGVDGVIEMTPYNGRLEWDETSQACFERGYVRLETPAPLAINRPGSVELFRDAEIKQNKAPSSTQWFENTEFTDFAETEPSKGATAQAIVPTLPWIHAMRQQAMNFLSAIRGEIKPMCTAEEALEDMERAREYLKLTKGI
ncbi:MAG TPA: dehydrogenase [Lentisphaeria bacterium]|nr:MAG: dehydrogenase [Lentisphaerae bacterium GWF2_50_93]HCE42793.1 dehydrogenase [Lentisphaeria bacterium]